MALEIERLMKLLAVSVVLIIVILVVINFVPQGAIVAHVIQQIKIPGITPKDLPCLFTCYTALQGDERIIISNTSFVRLNQTDNLITFFPCNEHTTMPVTLALGNARWKNPLFKYDSNCWRDNLFLPRYGLPWNYEFDDVVDGQCLFTELVDPYRDDSLNQDERAIKVMLDCILGRPECDLAQGGALYKWKWTFKDVCTADDYLRGFPNVPCFSTLTLYDLVFPTNFDYLYRSGADIDNYFMCYKSDRMYPLCTSSRSYDKDCQPAWALLDELDPNKGGETFPRATGRCEDFTILQYTLLRGVGVSADNLTLKVNYCDLPCPCKKMLDLCNLGTATITERCVSQSILEYDDGINLIEIPGCTQFMNNAPTDYYGDNSYSIPTSEYKYQFNMRINQSSTGVKLSNYNYELTLDGNYSNDLKTINLFNPSTSTNQLLTSRQAANSQTITTVQCLSTSSTAIKSRIINALQLGKSCDDVKVSADGQIYACGCIIKNNLNTADDVTFEYYYDNDYRYCFIRSLDCDPCAGYTQTDIAGGVGVNIYDYALACSEFLSPADVYKYALTVDYSYEFFDATGFSEQVSYSFNDVTGTRVNNPANNIFNASLVNGALITSTECRTGNCLFLDGVDDYLEINSTQVGNFGSLNSIIDFWVKPIPRLLNGEIASWRFDEIGGSVLYDDALAHNINMPAPANAPIRTIGARGGGLQFDGVNDYIEVPSFTNPRDEITVSAWIKSSSSTQYSGIYNVVSKYPGFILGKQDGYGMCFLISDSRGWIYNNCATKAQIGDISEWHHFVGVYKKDPGGYIKLYVDGALITTNPGRSSGALNPKGQISPDTGPLHIGHREADSIGTNHFNGFIDDVKIFNRALSDDEVSGLFNNRFNKMQTLLSKGNSGGQGFSINDYSMTGQLAYYHEGSMLPANLNLVPNLYDNEWHHVIVYNNLDRLFYIIDGTYFESTNNRYSSIGDEGKFILGSSGGAEPFYRGYIDDFKVLIQEPPDTMDLVSAITELVQAGVCSVQ